MTRHDSPAAPRRIAIVGSGPAAFYVADRLTAGAGPPVSVDMYERLPTPFGLVRFGVAPDHQKIKLVNRVFEKVAGRPAVRFFGNVEYGRHVTLEDLRRHYHQICFATGAQSDRQLGIPGEELEGSHPATEFVAWYNGHPDFRDRTFDLTARSVAVVGVGNVAVDVARILCRTPEELAKTDIADYAEAALERSAVREVHMLGRRGAAQAAFTNPEVRELGEMPGADVRTRSDELEVDPATRELLAAQGDTAADKKLAILHEFARVGPRSKPRLLTLRFLVSPVELLGDDEGHVRAVRLVRNELYQAEDGTIRARATDRDEELPVDLVFRSVGYRGVPLAGLPFDQDRGVVPHEAGRVIDPRTGTPVAGVYVSGWIKRGPTGVIGSNKPDAAETVACMVADATAGGVGDPAEPDPAAVDRVVRARQPDVVSLAEWRRLDELETARGEAQGRPRVKFTSVEEMLGALGRR